VIRRRKTTFIAIIAIVASIVGTNVVTGALVEARGTHARDHLASAQAAIPFATVLAVILWAYPARRDVHTAIVWAAALVALAGFVLIATGNLQVVHAIAGASWTDAQAQRLGPARPGFDAGHDLVDTGTRIAQLGAALAAVISALAGAIGWVAAIASVFLTAVFPPWILPGAGLLVIAIALLRARSRAVPAVR
jgi:hypothetical protein